MKLQNKLFYLKYILAGFAAVFYFIINFTFMSRSLEHDEVVYINNIRAIHYLKKSFYNPHHLHFEMSGRYFHGIMLKYFGKSGFTGIVFNLRLRSLTFAALGVFFLCLYLIKTTGKHIFGLLCTLSVVFTHGYLYNSGKIDTGIFPLVWVIVTLYIFRIILKVKSKRKFIILSVLTGLCLYAGILLHQYFIFVVISLLISLIVPEMFFKINLKHKGIEIKNANSGKDVPLVQKSIKHRFTAFAVILIITSLPTILTYFYIGKIKYGLSYKKYTRAKKESIWKYYSFQQWLTAYQMNVEWGNGFKNFNPKSVLRGITDAFITPVIGNKYNKNLNFLYNLKKPYNEKSITHNSLLYYLLIVFLGLIFFLTALLKLYKRQMIFILLNLIMFTVLGLYWEPYYSEFWLIPVLLLMIISFFVLILISKKLKVVLKNLYTLPVYVVILVIVVLIGGYNFKHHLIKNAVHKRYEGIWGLEKGFYKWLLVSPVYKKYTKFHNPYSGILRKEYINKRFK